MKEFISTVKWWVENYGDSMPKHSLALQVRNDLIAGLNAVEMQSINRELVEHEDKLSELYRA